MTTASLNTLSHRPMLALVLMLVSVLQPLSALAAETEKNRQSENSPSTPSEAPQAPTKKSVQRNPATTVLPETSVSSSRIRDDRINTTQSITKITAEDMERRQVSTVFDAVRNTPGVSIDGGPRLNGMSFNIRGFDSSDVAVSVDGVLKNYEKYRSRGTYIEPDLLKTIEIRRGPQISTNSGYVGGAVITTTKDAEDFLRPGQMMGGRVKFGYGNNNDEYLRSYLAYARPHERVDLIYNYTNRQSNNLTQGNGDELAYSNLNIESELFKVTLYPTDALRISTSLTKLKQGPTVQLFDTITGMQFATPYVLRAIDEETISQTWEFTPGSDWINLKAILGTGHTQQNEVTPFGWDGNRPFNPMLYCVGFTAYNRFTGLPGTATQSATTCTGDRLDDYNFRNTNFDLSNRAKIFHTTDLDIELLTGVQYSRQKTITKRSYDNPLSPRIDANATPSGIRTSTAFYIQPTMRIKQLSITPGYRKDYYFIEALNEIKDALDFTNRRHKIRAKEEIYNLALAYDVVPNNLTLFANYGQGFRPIANGYAFPIQAYLSNGDPVSASLCPDDHSSCDDAYKTQRTENTEAGISYVNSGLFGQPLQLTSKATFFHSHSSHVVLGISNYLPNYGTQIRNGWEFENNLSYKAFYAQASYSRIAGRTIVESSGRRIPIFSLPGNAVNITLGFNISSTFDFHVHYRRVSDKDIISGAMDGVSGNTGIQEGYELFNVGMRWSPNKHLNFRLVGENIKDTHYYLDGGFAGDRGLPGPGRNIKFYTELIY
ncbi:MAG: TonB-dependent receptor [Methylobacillus sp.]|nr:TonB-dependent receptor [Methylobacillus sp.]